MLILLELYRGKGEWKRYSHIKTKLNGITPKMLSARLKELKGEGMIKKRVDVNTFPIRSEYCLTKTGKDFIKIIKSIKEWTLKWKTKNTDCEKNDCEMCEL